MKALSIILLLLVPLNVLKIPESPSTLWFGYYQEDRANNPEDPMPGFIYLNIPNDGTFEGELFFSYAGCDGTFDVGRVTGTVSGDRINGNWKGNVDGEAVGGSYTGKLNDQRNKYTGTYTNRSGKQEIKCGDMGGYYVAGHGQWYLKGSGADGNLDISVETEAQNDYTEFNWSEIDNTVVYRFVIIDQECLMERMNLEECMVWAGESDWSDMVYGDGDVPAKPLVENKTYIITLYALDGTGVVLESGSKEFKYQ